MSRKERQKNQASKTKKTKSKKVTVKATTKKAVDDVIIEDGKPVLEVNDGKGHEDLKDTSKEEVVAVESESTKDTVENPTVDSPTPENVNSDCGAKPKEEVENNVPTENTTERQNEKDSIASSDGSAPENTSVSTDSKTEEDSNPTPDTGTGDIPTKDSSASTTDKVEPVVEKNSDLSEKPIWYRHMAETNFFMRHSKAIHPHTGENIELHACNAFDGVGKPIEIKAKGKLDKPIVNAMCEEDKQKAYAEYDSALAERNFKVQEKRRAIYKRIAPLIPKLMADHLKVVHVWNKKSDRALGLTGVLKGLQGGRSPYTVLIDGTVDGKPKKIRRGFRFYSTTLPDGIEKAPQVPLRDACEVEKEVDKKLLEDKSSNNLVLPKGYIGALANNNNSDRRFHSILVWNSEGKQLAFFASPVEGQPNMFKWAVMSPLYGDVMIHNDAIRMQGSVESLLRTTVKVNQDNIEALTIVSIPEDDLKQLGFFLEVLSVGTVESENDSEPEKSEK